MNKQRTAILGFGSIASTHVAAIKDEKISDITAICDIRPERLEAAAKEFPNARLYNNYIELLEDRVADVIHICSPHYLHKPMAILALETGHDVYLEKPAGMNSSEIQAIIDASDKYGKKVCVSFQNRVIPSSWTSREIITSGELGAVKGAKGFVTWSRGGKYYTESGWRGTWEREGGGVLMNQSIHTLDLMYFLGGDIKSVEGSASLRVNKGTIEVEDTAEATIYYKAGGVGIFYATNCYVGNSPVEIEIVCEKGTLLIRDDILYIDKGEGMTPITENKGLEVGKSYWGAGHATLIKNFYSVLRGGNDYYCDIRDTLPSMHAIESIYHTAPFTNPR